MSDPLTNSAPAPAEPALYRVLYDTAAKKVTAFDQVAARTQRWVNGEGCFYGSQAECEAFISARKLTPLPAPALATAKAAKIANIRATLTQPVTVSGITLAVDPDTQTQLNHLVTMLQLAYSQEPESNQPAFLATHISTITGPILDAAEASHDMTVSQSLQLVLLYGQAYGSARAAALAQIAAVNAATTVAEVNAVGAPAAVPPAS